jgi:hypothetical protein
MTDIIQGTDAWHELRKGKVTASRVADIMAKTKTGASASRGNYMIQLALERVTGTVEQTFTSPAMQDGIDREVQARSLYEVTTGNFVSQLSFVDHPTIKWFGCSPDGIVDGQKGLIEIKCRNNANHWEVIKTKEIPKNYWIQQQAQLFCMEYEFNDYVGFNPNFPEKSQLFIKRVYRDEVFISLMETEIKQFLEEVAEETERIKNGN